VTAQRQRIHDSRDPVTAEASPRPSPRPAVIVRRTRRSVLIVDKIAEWGITIGGIAVIAAVFGIMVFLVSVVLPLFGEGEVSARTDVTVAEPIAKPLSVLSDEYNTTGLLVGADGRMSAFHLKTGGKLQPPSLDFGGRSATAYSASVDHTEHAFGFEDGSIRFARIGFKAEVLPPERHPASLQRLNGRDLTDGTVVYEQVPGGQLRRISVEAKLDPPVEGSAKGRPVVAVDYRLGGTAERPTRIFAVLDADGNLSVNLAESKVNMMTRKTTLSVTRADLPPAPLTSPLRALLVTTQGDQLYVAEQNGRLHRYDIRDFSKPALVETAALFPQTVGLAAIRFLIGEQTIVATGGDGSVANFSKLPREGFAAKDGFALVRTRSFDPQGAPVDMLDQSSRGKTFATLDRGGGVWLRHATSERTLVKMQAGSGAPIVAMALAPRDDGLLVIRNDGKASSWEISAPHPETSLRALFGKVWYEGYPAPSFTWQSSSGTDSFEPKLSLVPLVFGTIKATFYALLFAIPIALLAAIYTSEFLHPRIRAAVKPSIEVMASLPSVVLGFIAALILAPVVETWVAAVMLGFAVVPLCLLATSYLWQALPVPVAARLDGLPRLALMILVLSGGLWLSYEASRPLERLLFAGDFKAWARGDGGSATPLLFLILLPLAFLAASWVAQRIAGDRLRALLHELPRSAGAAVDGLRWLATLMLAFVIGWAAASLLAAIGLDARGGLVDTYVQRNALVVGFAMAFAVIPLIYTLAEDALNAVPPHLRAASLACGATPWQTAVRIVLPTAMSGVFAAVMIGMGRAVGETMIVVMAAGNTPLMDWNLFNGLRALSANIAVELPEAPKDGTLYRVLFLAGLVLFVLTFAINTLAETVRLRFRRRAAQM
jgi:phosphate transport system permease protein